MKIISLAIQRLIRLIRRAELDAVLDDDLAENAEAHNPRFLAMMLREKDE